MWDLWRWSMRETRVSSQPSTNPVEDKPALWISLCVAGMMVFTDGSGADIVVNPANKAVAPTVPRRWYICPAKSGNAAANVVRTKVLAAMDDAAIGL